MPKAEMAAARLGVRLVPLTASTPAELRALTPSALSGSDGLLVIAEAFFHYNRATIIGLASTARVPAIYPEREYADDGGLIAYGPNVVEHFRQAAGYVDRFFAVRILVTFQSTLRRNSTSSSTSKLPVRLG
jgi:putative tryptophan/tyrosine transport system substrate-binding protein